MTKMYKKEEVENLVGALEFHAREVLTIADKAQREANKHSYKLYGRFREKVSEYETFAIIIEQRLKNMDPDHAAQLQEQFDELSFLVMNGLIDASIKFFKVLSQNEVLPLGAKKLFMDELRRLHKTQHRMSEDKYNARLDDKQRKRFDLAENILGEIIDRAPNLLNFGETVH